jgi:hypothetical protein
MCLWFEKYIVQSCVCARLNVNMSAWCVDSLQRLWNANATNSIFFFLKREVNLWCSEYVWLLINAPKCYQSITRSIIWFFVASFLNSVLLFCLGYLLPNWYSVLSITHFSLNLLLNYILSCIPWVCTGSDYMWPKMQLHSCGWLIQLTFGKCSFI